MILVFGAGGQLGQELLRAAAQRGVSIHGLTRAEANICDEAAVDAAMERLKPTLVVNAGAYTAVDKAESERDAAIAGNAVGPRILAQAAARRGVPILHVSTDYVFDGSKDGAYVETDPIQPLGVYGETKAAGEAAVAKANPKHVIMRTAWVYGVYGANFLKTMIRLARERDELRVVGDQYGCPTSTSALADAILTIAPRLVDAAQNDDRSLWGVYHVTGSGRTNWHGFASAIVEAAAPHLGRKPTVTAITTADYPTPARRPANSVLDNEKFARVFQWRAPDWRDDARKTVDALLTKDI